MSSSPRFFASDARRRHHFLDSCFLCKKRIPKNEDIFMYRGDAPFCSMECRREQMDMDEALENERILCSASYSAASASAQPAPMKRKLTLISIPATCDEKNRYRPDTAVIVAR